MDPSDRTASNPRPPEHTPPDPASLLLEAVRRRDRLSSLQLAQRWVHRRGLASLEGFRCGPLTAGAGREASAWLEALLAQTGAAPSGAELQPTASRPTISERPQPGLEIVSGQTRQGTCHGPAVEPSVQAARQAMDQRVISEVDAAIAAMLATFPQDELGTWPPSVGGGLEGVTADSTPTCSGSGSQSTAEPSEGLHQPGAAEGDQGWVEPLCWPTDAATGESADPVEPPSEPECDQVAASCGPDAASGLPPAREGLRQRLRRHLPGAAGMLRAALSLPETAAWWKRLALAEADGEPTLEAPVSEDLSGQRQVDLTRQGSRTVDISEPEAAPHPSRGEGPRMAVPAQHPRPSAADRLRQRLSRPSEPGADLPPPAPRPGGLADLTTWLPDSDLPRAS